MPNDQFFSYIMANTCYIQRDDEVRYVLDQHIQWDFFFSSAHWNNSLLVEMSLHSNTLSWFQSNQYLVLLLNTVCLVFGLTRQWL